MHSRMTEHDIIDGHLIVTQEKTKQPLRIQIIGELAALLARIQVHKATYKIKTTALLVNQSGKRLTAPALRTQFYKACDAVIARTPELEKDVKNCRFYDLRAKATDDTANDRGQEAARDLLGHDSVKTTQRHYLRRGKVVTPTK